MIYSFTIPLPPRALSQNAHYHWRQRHKAANGTERATGYRDVVKLLAKNAKPSDWYPRRIRVSTDWYMGPSADPDIYRPRDEPNAIGALKAAYDGIVDAGWIPDDTRKWLKVGDVELKGTQKEHGGKCQIVVTIEVID